MDKNDVHLKINMKLLFYLGAFRFRLKNPLYDVAYRGYSLFIKGYFVMFVITQYTELITMPDKDLFNVIAILAVSLLYTTTVWKMAICNGIFIQKLVQQLRAIEKRILLYNNRDIRHIYFEHAKKNYFCSWFLLYGTITSSLYYIRPIIEEKSRDPIYMNVTKNNVTLQYRVRPLPLGSWFPFNRYKYYYFCYFHQIFATMIGGSMVVLTGLLFVALMIFVIGQLKILQYSFKNASKLALNMSVSSSMSHDRAVRYTIGHCINTHKMIIR